MADCSSFCLITAMDRLWFHHTILLSEPSPPFLHPTTSSLDQQHISPESPPLTLQDEPNDELRVEEIPEKERPARLSSTIIRNRPRSHSSSPVSSERLPRLVRHESLIRNTLQKSRSCRSMGELELEEVKGFMDLGFVFRKEHLSPGMIKVIPGLQRLRLLHKTEPNIRTDHREVGEANHRKRNEDTEELEEEDEKGVIRPYLSEAWLIKRPDSPLLNLRMPSRISASADMKKHIKSWARTVASVIQQES